jgi:hypothetical protein
VSPLVSWQFNGQTEEPSLREKHKIKAIFCNSPHFIADLRCGCAKRVAFAPLYFLWHSIAGLKFR